MQVTIKEAASIISKGGVVAFPTETVYGIGADATNNEACKLIYKIKGRPSNNPLILHVSSIEQAEKIAHFSKAAKILTKFWPGPLTLVLPRKDNYPMANVAAAGLNTVALRMPMHKTALELIKLTNVPIAAPSANKSGMLSTTRYEDVLSSFLSDDVPMIAEKGACEYGLESTIVDLSSNAPVILRYGFITPEAIENALGTKLFTHNNTGSIKAPGMLAKHYSPTSKLRLDATKLSSGEIGLNFGDSKLDSEFSLSLSINGDLAEAAANLYKMLHLLDQYAQKHSKAGIGVAPIPNSGIGLAINDRLERAVA